MQRDFTLNLGDIYGRGYFAEFVELLLSHDLVTVRVEGPKVVFKFLHVYPDEEVSPPTILTVPEVAPK